MRWRPTQGDLLDFDIDWDTPLTGPKFVLRPEMPGKLGDLDKSTETTVVMSLPRVADTVTCRPSPILLRCFEERELCLQKSPRHRTRAFTGRYGLP